VDRKLSVPDIVLSFEYTSIHLESSKLKAQNSKLKAQTHTHTHTHSFGLSGFWAFEVTIKGKPDPRRSGKCQHPPLPDAETTHTHTHTLLGFRAFGL
jgi:hypothetical protein